MPSMQILKTTRTRQWYDWSDSGLTWVSYSVTVVTLRVGVVTHNQLLGAVVRLHDGQAQRGDPLHRAAGPGDHLGALGQPVLRRKGGGYCQPNSIHT